MHANLAIPEVNHPVTTQIDPKNDFCRRVLMTFFSPPVTFVRDLLKTQPQHSLTALYRGFSRFMFEDLAFHTDFLDQTISQRKKAAEQVAREMILRNQAYSRLVERIAPNHIRLSIHAHDSAGPKFPVQLLKCRPIADDSPDLIKAFKDSQESQETLHIPTPWHNTIAEVYFDHDDDTGGPGVGVVVCKASLLVNNMSKCVGGYDRNHPRGGRFLLWLDKKRWAESQHLFDHGVAVPGIAVNEEDFRYDGQRYEFTRSRLQRNDSSTH